MAGNTDTYQLESIAEDEISKALKDLKKLQHKKGARFTVDSKGVATKHYSNGGCVMAGRGGKFKGVL